MITQICPKLPMRNKQLTRQFYVEYLGFTDISASDYPDYILLSRDGLELHFFLHPALDPSTNYGQVYIRVEGIDSLFAEFLQKKTPIQHSLASKPWGQREFSLLDSDHNSLTFGESL